MRTNLIGGVALFIAFLSPPTQACGGGFGQEVTIDPAQTLVIGHHAGIESYVFQPRFCGAASEFGLILPVPAVLNSDPSLVESALYAQLAVVTAPRVETVDVCASPGLMGSDSKSADSSGDMYSASRNSDGVDVVDQGSVGIFSWTLLKADSAKTFTDWLDTNQFAYPASAVTVFDHYVQAGFYFVAFQVTVSNSAPPSGYRICGDFGPIRLAFASPKAVIPARMATAGDSESQFYWRLFTVADHEYALAQGDATTAQVTTTLRFAGQLNAKELSQNPAVATVAKTGDWLTELDLSFAAGALTGDMTLAAAPADEAYQRVVYVENEVNCGVFGCNVATTPNGSRWWGAILAVGGGLLVLASRKRRRTRRR